MSYYFYDPEAQSFESFITDSLNDLFKKNPEHIVIQSDELNGVLNPDFENILYFNHSEILFYSDDKNSNVKDKYYKFIVNKLPTKVNTNFGCELETCFILNCKEEVKDEILKIIKSDNIADIQNVYQGVWQDLIIYHLRKNVIPFLSKEFISRFKFAYIFNSYHSERGIHLDLSNGRIVTRKLEKNNYQTLIFEPDGSIKCDLNENQIPISCEIVTPILSSLDEIKLLYDNLIFTSCNQSNKSMGFHVNVSGVDENDKQIHLTRGMLTELIYKWLPYEKKNYKKLRGDGSYYARQIRSFLNDDKSLDFANSVVKDKVSQEINKDEFYEKYGLNIWTTVAEISKEKFYSLTNHKQNNVIEFRVFPSDNNIDKLLEYTQDAINVFQSSIQSYCDNPQETIINLQETYCKYMYFYEVPIKYFSGRLWDFGKDREDIKIHFGYMLKKGLFRNTYVAGISYWKTPYTNYIIEYKNGDQSVYYSYTFSSNMSNIILSHPKLISFEEYSALKKLITYVD